MKKIDYLAYIDRSKLVGVNNKIEQTVFALNKKGYRAESVFFDPGGVSALFKICRRVLLSRADVIIIRSIVSFMPILFPFLLFKRILGVDIVVDVPTPYSVALDEIKAAKEGSVIGRLLRILVLWIGYPWAWYPATRLIQYAPESAYFSFGIKHKIVNCCNGIDASNITYRKCVPSWPSSSFVFICVASIADWHGLDRLIRSISYYRYSLNFDLKFIIVGDGEAKKSLMDMVNELGLENIVEFKGYLQGESLDEIFERAHVAISSLGLYRKGLDVASDLKSREYASRGIPFVSSGYDADFDPLPEFVFSVSNDDTLVDIDAIVTWYNSLLTNDEVFFKEREYALSKLDFSTKVDALLGA